MVTTDPVQGFVLPGSLTVTVTDPNVTDDIFIRWIAEYPPYNPMITHLLGQDSQVSHSLNGTQVTEMRSFSPVTCFNLTRGTGAIAHPITALVSDRMFQDPSAATSANAEQVLTRSADQHALYAEAHWVLNVECQ